ncbi:APH(3') family aminoglycoside O-phosphotransferase [Clostridium sp. 1001271B_151109_B4]|uniref:APH(3') family aminoglycoside O-phosphotransferase n=1 Tax=Clostridium sp. 1001271B_151109_B4 TaxID=2787148 RepID=UPI0018AAB762|nr:APH(3') family aminoglycoside O-phosphotransferase [Clostridium sp. 1001271B_151109_B4]
MEIPIEIKKIIEGKAFNIDTVGLSDSQVFCFDDMVLKIQKNDDEAINEIKITNWLSGNHIVPKVLCTHIEDKKCYLLMSKVKGKMSCDTEFLRNPEKLAELLAEGLKILWSINLKGCPCDSSIDKKLKMAEERVNKKICSMEDIELGAYGEEKFSSPEELLQWLKENKPNEEPVLSHGDYCLPNIFIDNDKISGFIDLGRCGIGDKYQDIALCYRSLKSNLNGRYGGEVIKDISAEIIFEKLGIDPDWDKIRYYILLDELF